MEIELKMQIDSRYVKTFRNHPLLKKYALSVPYDQKMSDTYFDTPDLDIQRSNAGLRVRRINRKWVQTLKYGGGVNGGLHSRHEWETTIAAPVPNLPELHNMVGHKAILSKLLRSTDINQRLSPIFTSRVTRSIWKLRLPQGDEVECVLDLGKIECNNQEVRISEIEIELKSGDPVHLFDFALALLQDVPLQIGTLSKADRGYALYALPSSIAVKAIPIRLSKQMTLEQAFQQIASNCMAQIQGNASCLARNDEPESVHQMRVGLRRLDTVLDLFKKLLQPPAEMLQELDWLAAQLGAARDWDVLAGSTLPAIADLMPEEIRLIQLTQAAVDAAHERHKAAAAAVCSPRFTRLILSFTRWVLGCDWRDTQSSQNQRRFNDRMTRFSGDMLEHQHNRLLKRGKKLKVTSPAVRHRVRIAAKTTRYTTEFFQSIFPRKKVRPFVAALSALQEELGLLNDKATALDLLRELRDQHIYLEESANFLCGYLICPIDNDNKKIRMLWKTFKAIKFRS